MGAGLGFNVETGIEVARKEVPASIGTSRVFSLSRSENIFLGIKLSLIVEDLLWALAFVWLLKKYQLEFQLAMAQLTPSSKE